MPNLTNKKEIEFTVEELEQILVDHLDSQYNIVGDTSFNFKVARKQIPSQYPSDSYDHHVFDGVKIIVEVT